MSKRTYHSWTEEESARLYKFVLRCERNWAEVQRQFPQFSMLQLQNRFQIMRKQMQLKEQKNDEKVAEAVNNTETIQQLVNLFQQL
ncbi:Myb-like_DNA-binding domain-containing protein [Hexamita inflata]|uniref:Myb-like DNA-binding domain-containing protein n=1 Tax=Hexamita inflata TaxID=28002 RepID=A0AA86Q957_9EUKA|nr:Myb-like DNA-binding domain-containing protein [Hexamita inflata]CAI9959674.1 Myb-like DNA-binding domain-containing protein [Hexamita inflata]